MLRRASAPPVLTVGTSRAIASLSVATASSSGRAARSCGVRRSGILGACWCHCARTHQPVRGKNRCCLCYFGWVSKAGGRSRLKNPDAGVRVFPQFLLQGSSFFCRDLTCAFHATSGSKGLDNKPRLDWLKCNVLSDGTLFWQKLNITALAATSLPRRRLLLHVLAALPGLAGTHPKVLMYSGPVLISAKRPFSVSTLPLIRDACEDFV